MNEPSEKILADKNNYEKPLLRTIKLAAEEVLVVGCKTQTTNGHFSPCIPGGKQPCQGVGS